MGILNTTPDSFSDGGVFISPGLALDHVRRMVAEGADIIDVGGESTRPGALPVSADDEMDRVIPVIEAIRSEMDIPISIDTSKGEVMEQAVKAGACMINDVMALRAPGALEAASRTGVPVCLMHMQGEPRSMQKLPQYNDVVQTVKQFFQERIEAAVGAGIERRRIILDPGFGFGKTLEHNLTLLSSLNTFKAFNLPLLVGISRKSMIGAILDDAAVDQRLFGSISAAVLAVERGATILRVHDVKPTVDALAVATAVHSADS